MDDGREVTNLERGSGDEGMLADDMFPMVTMELVERMEQRLGTED